MITYCTYFDHTVRGGYYPELVTANWKSCDSILICSPEDLPGCTHVDHRILVPNDIPAAINLTTTMAFAGGADYVVFIYGDLYLTQIGDLLIHDYILHADKPFGTLPSMGVQLYVNMYVHNNQVLISNREQRAISNPLADGEEMSSVGKPITDDTSLVLDIGYLSSMQYYKRLKSHASIWGYDDYKKEFITLYERGDIAGAVRRAYKNIRKWANRPLAECDVERYKGIMEMWNLEEDHKMCVDILKGFMV